MENIRANTGSIIFMDFFGGESKEIDVENVQLWQNICVGHPR